MLNDKRCWDMRYATRDETSDLLNPFILSPRHLVTLSAPPQPPQYTHQPAILDAADQGFKLKNMLVLALDLARQVGQQLILLANPFQ